MTEEQIKVAVKYLGCDCNYLGEHQSETFTLETIIRVIKNNGYGFNLYLLPLSALTQEDFERMYKELWGRTKYIEPVHYWRGYSSVIEWKEADWLRNNGYYLGEESIKEFIKLK